MPEVTVRGHPLMGGAQKDGIASFLVAPGTFAKGGNAVEIVVPQTTILWDFSVRVTYDDIPPMGF